MRNRTTGSPPALAAGQRERKVRLQNSHQNSVSDKLPDADRAFSESS